MHGLHRILSGILFTSLVLGLMFVPRPAMPQSGGAAGQTAQDNSIPAYHKELPDGPLPATMDPSQFDNPTVRNAYSVAAGMRKTLYQQPCYCHCDQHEGHGSLLDCFVGNHTAGCGVCMKEAFYVYEQLHKGKKAAQIREGIVRGEWNQVDLKKYETPMPLK